MQILKSGKYKFYVRPRDHWVVEEWEYDTKLMKFDGIDTIVDIGAHIGVFSINHAKYVRDVYAYEPFDENYNLLNKNIELNEIKNIKTYELAVSKDNTDKMIYRSDKTNARHTLYPPPHLASLSFQEEYKKVKCITLDKILKDKKNIFLKSDCEGSEFDFLFNQPKELFKNVKRMSVETHQDKHSKYTYRDFIKYLNDIGYKTCWTKVCEHKDKFLAIKILGEK